MKASSSILDLQPGTSAETHALRTRAKANEALGFFKQALSDAQTIIAKGDSVSEEVMAMERRLKDVISANKAKLSGGTNPTTASKNASAPPFPMTVTVKATLGDDTRVLHASIMMTYVDLYEAIKAKFAGIGAFSVL